MKTREITALKAKGKVFLEIYLHQNNVLESRWYGFTTHSVFTSGVDKIAEVMDEYKIHSYLADLTEHQGVGPDSQLYAAQKISQYVQKHSLPAFKQVMVLSDNIFTKVSVGGYTKRIENNIETIVSNNLGEAYREFDLVSPLTNG